LECNCDWDPDDVQWLDDVEQMRAVPSVTQFVGLSTSLWTHYMVIWLYLMVLTSDYTCFARSSALSEHNKFNAIQEIGDEDSHISYGDNNNDNRDSFHTSSSVQTSSESSTNNILLDFGVIPLIGVTSKQDLLAVSTTDTITVFQLSHDSVALKNVSLRNAFNSQQLYRIQLKPPCDFDLVEFKFLNQSSIFICDAVLCRRVFVQNIFLILGYDAIALRYVNANGEAAILKYDILTNTSQKPISPSQYANDISIINNQRTVTAFNRNGFSYFVGSANRPYEPLINSKINEEAELTSVQLTRICDRDATENLESRIDLALGCPHIALNGNALASAAEYDEVSDRLTVVFHSLTTAHGHDSLSSSESSDSICTYNMADINQKFEKIWNDCQNTTISASQDDCYSALDVKSLPNHCFIFTRLADGHAMTPCSRFGGNHQSPRAQNCDLHKLTSLAYRYENSPIPKSSHFRSIFRLPSDSAEILSLGHVQGDNAIFTLDANGRLHRIGHDLPTKTNTHLWSRYLLSQWRRFAFVADSKRNKIYYIENNQIKYVEVSCTGLYQNCDALERSKWSDPLGCLWCAKSNESGKTIARTDRCTDISITDICPPYIKHVNLSPESPHSTVVELYGDKFDRLQGMSVSVCNRSCPVKMVEHNRVSCLLSKKFEDTSSCVINAEGELGKHGPFALEYNHTRQRLRRKQADAASLQIPFDTMNGSITGHFLASSADCNAYIGHNGNGYLPRRFNPYEQLFSEIDPKLKVPLNDLIIGDEIGKDETETWNIYHDTNLSDSWFEYDNVMLVCWNEDPNRRPTFHELIDMMQDVVSQLRNGAPGNSLLTNHYERVSPRSAATTPIAYPKPIAAPVTTAL
uniref:C-Met/RON-like tyrosine kinase (inferred by orthology to a C. elegans protein) n=1 Tax=Anisakis simplex TaxID=6269 RepID=A0A0M3JVD2_ANISI